MIEANAAQLAAPAHTDWILARVAALLMGYYTADIPAQIVQIEAEDWVAELDEFPAWAITKAVRWWKGEGNPDRRKKPLPGDIAARARLEFGPVLVARLAVTRFDAGKKPWQTLAPPFRKSQSTEERQRIAAEVLSAANFAPKRMDQPQ